MSPAETAMIRLTRRVRLWLNARTQLVDVLFACLIGLLVLADLGGQLSADRANDPDTIGVVLILIGATSLVWRRSRPVPVFALILTVSCLFYVRDYGSFMAEIGLSGFYAVAAHEKNRRHAWLWMLGGCTLLLGVASLTVLDGADGFNWTTGLSMTVTIAAVVIAGVFIRNKEVLFTDTRERAERAEAGRLAEAERAVTRERLRIAREMHDVVAHGMSLITVQAAAAQEVAPTNPEEAARLMGSVEATGRDALAEMRRMLGVLRNDDGDDRSEVAGEFAPQPSLADLGATIEHCRLAGTPTELIVTGDERPLPPGIELAAFRIAQEALTNVIKHGGAVATATVELGYDDDMLHLTISDTGRGAVSNLSETGSGHGLIGMRERVETYDGKLASGPRPGGGYQVAVSLPLETAGRLAVAVAADIEGGEAA